MLNKFLLQCVCILSLRTPHNSDNTAHVKTFKEMRIYSPGIALCNLIGLWKKFHKRDWSGGGGVARVIVQRDSWRTRVLFNITFAQNLRHNASTYNLLGVN